MEYVASVDFGKIPDFKGQYVVAKKSVVKYANIPIAFDIETTSYIMQDGTKIAFMYEFTFGFRDKEHIYYGRTWEEFIDLLNKMIEAWELNNSKRAIIYVHNLGFEFQFMRKYFEWSEVFASSEYKPIKAVTIDGIEFRDSYILSGLSLAKVADNLTKHKIEKLLGDLDYKLIRHSQTPLTEKELGYCFNDVLILIYYIAEQIEMYDGYITRIPLTNTGRVRKFVRDNCFHYKKNHRKEGRGGKGERYRELMQECVVNLDEYILLKKCFMGGFTHASIKWSGEKLENVGSYDITSSYPYSLLSEKYPMSSPRKVDLTKEDFYSLVDDDNYCMMFTIRFVNLQSKLTYESYISESKCEVLKGEIINNGRVFYAKELITTITDIDFRIIKAVYTWDSIQVKDCYKFYMTYLPTQIIKSVLQLYRDKTILKGIRGYEAEYLLKKGMLNSVYGMCVTDIIMDEAQYADGEWTTVLGMLNAMEQLEQYNNKKNRFLYYPWGVWCTAWSRKNIWTAILNVGEDYVYCDTDSVKMLNPEKHKEFFDYYNNEIVPKKLQKMCEARAIDYELCKPRTQKGEEKLIGVFDFEGIYDEFKTLGAKRYCYTQDGEFHITVAGLGKKAGAKYIEEQAEKQNISIFDVFDDNLYVPPSRTGKNTHYYINEEYEAEVTDYLGNTLTVKTLSGVHLEECEFTMSMSGEYLNFLVQFRNGFVYGGTMNEKE